MVILFAQSNLTDIDTAQKHKKDLEFLKCVTNCKTL